MTPVDRIRRLAEVSVGRGCAFAALAILTLAVGLSYDLVVAAKASAILSLMMASVLLWKARAAPRKSYRSTEVWAMLDKRRPLSEEQTQRVVAEALRGAYLRYARRTAWIAGALWVVSLAAAVLPRIA